MELLPDSRPRELPVFPVMLVFCFALTLVIAGAVRWYQLGDLPYWFDESYSLRTARFSLREIVISCTEDTHPPLFYFILKGWVACWGEGEIPARLLSILFSLGAVGAAFGLTYEALRSPPERRVSRAAALFSATLAGLLVGLSPIHISWSQQVRMYAPVACLSLLGTWLLWRAINQPERTRRWVAYAAVELAGLYTHVTMLFIFVAHLVAMGVILIQGRTDWQATKKLAWRAAIFMGIVGLLFLPWFVILRTQQARVQGDFWLPPLTWENLGNAFTQCFIGSQHFVSDSNIGIGIAQGLLIVLVLVATSKQQVDLLIVLTAGIPFVLLLALSLISNNLVNSRYFISGQALVCVALAVGIARLPTWLLRVPVAILLIGVLTVSVNNYHSRRQSLAHQRAIQQVLTAWQEHSDSGQPLVFCNPTYYITAQIYAPDADFKVFGQKLDYPFFNGTAVTAEYEFLSTDQINSGDWKTVWVLDLATSKRNRPSVALSSEWRLSSEASMKDYSGEFSLKRYDRMD